MIILDCLKIVNTISILFDLGIRSVVLVRERELHYSEPTEKAALKPMQHFKFTAQTSIGI